MAETRALIAGDVAKRCCEKVYRVIRRSERCGCAKTPLFNVKKPAGYFLVNLNRQRPTTSRSIFFVYILQPPIVLLLYLLRREACRPFRCGQAIVTFGSRLSRLVLLVCSFIGIMATGAAAQTPYDEIGLASWYGAKEAGHRTASGIPFDPTKLSAAHRSLPLGSCIRVTRLANQISILVPVIDRGPFHRGRLLDLSQAAAERLGMAKSGVAKVRVALSSCPNFASLQIAHNVRIAP